MARIVLVVTSRSYRATDFLRAAARLGVDVTVASDHAAVFGHAADHLQIEFVPPGEGVSAILHYATRHRVDAVLATDPRTVGVAARAARALGLRHNDPRAVDIADDKHRMRVALERAGRLTPRFERVSLQRDLSAVARRLDYPVVVKPLHLCASQGVIRADEPQAFIAACRRIEGILAGRGERVSRRQRHSVIVEAYISGREVALEGLIDDGVLRTLALFDKPGVSSGPYFEETVYVTPSRLGSALHSAVAREVQSAAAAIGLRSGALHAECRVNEAGVWTIELSPRSIGGLCSRSLVFVPGMTLEELIVRHALGMSCDNFRLTREASGVMMIPTPSRGRLRAVRGVDAARALSGIEDVTIGIPAGEMLVPLPEGDRYVGFIFARGEHPDAVEASLAAAHRTLRFDIDRTQQHSAASR